MTKTLAFKNHYSGIGEKKEFWIEPDQEELTDQSQIVGASIVEMAKKFGIDAIIAKAEQRNIESEKLKDILYGHDFTKMFNSAEELLNCKKNISNYFENVPARMRKELFNDDINEFVNAYTSSDEKKLSKLNSVGIISDSQFMAVKEQNTRKQQEIAENLNRQRFIDALEKEKAGLYETYKKTGTINYNSNQNSTTDSTNV